MPYLITDNNAALTIIVTWFNVSVISLYGFLYMDLQYINKGIAAPCVGGSNARRGGG